jgi:TPR repeat protein
MRPRAVLTLAIGLVTLLSSLVGGAGEVQASSLTLEQAQDRAQFILLLRKARQGDGEAQWAAAATYLRLGEIEAALPLLASAAATGNVLALSQFGVLYEEGRGVDKNPEKAIDWYRKAADQGDAASMAGLARLLPRSDPQGANYLRRAALAGNADAQYALGLEIAARGEDKFLAESHEWLLKSAQQGHIGAQIAVGQQFLEGKVVKSDAAQGADWLERAARSGNPVANFMVGRIYHARGRSSDEAARKHFFVAANAGHREAQFLYGKLLADSKTNEEKREAAEWLEKAWAAGHVEAANRLGELLREPVDGLQQPARARAFFLSAAQKGNVDAMYNFAEMQHAGVGGEKDAFDALKWYGRAADGKHKRAMEVVESLLGSTLKTSSLGSKGFWQ